MGHLPGMGTYTFVRLPFILGSSPFSITSLLGEYSPVLIKFYRVGLEPCGV